MMETSLLFILKLRRACETVFDVMLCAYISGLKAYHTASKVKGKKEGSKRPSFDGWDQALHSAEKALRMFREAEILRQNGDPSCTDTYAQEALSVLQERIISIFLTLSQYRMRTNCVQIQAHMTSWDREQVLKA
jgi:hypothetical protein